MIVKRNYVSVLVVALVLLSLQPVHAGAGMSEEQMQQMMQQAEAMQKCMADVDPSAISQLQDRSNRLQAEVRALCEAGKRDQAQDTALKVGKEISTSKEMQAIKKCGEMAQQMLAQMPSTIPDPSDKSAHVCDYM